MSTNDGVKQRRGKGNAPSDKSNTNEKRTIQRFSADDHLTRAEATVQQNKIAAQELYAQWRQHLQRISYLLVFVSFHMAQTPMTDCIKDMKEANAGEQVISGKQAIGMILYESMSEIVGICLCACLAFFLSMKPHGDFSSPAYMCSAALIPLQIGLYRQTKRIGCTGDMDLLREGSDRAFPIGVLFHVIATVAYWFMDKGMKKINQNVTLVENLRKELNASNEKNARAKAAKSKGK
eukprot:CAMPEP_0195310290 /NCGR_PEP_ID=MMETSP0707-20130614/39172_1 /TAXON_ID=33640 /ORGANISM="Asterionellopsis glacialis, Strain CCMP134" /LENGTH=235 /DNA_ID=CAMNT_0040374603 /DNA_START=36 /DNA_END=743 /DNA_ORIENTATION=-